MDVAIASWARPGKPVNEDLAFAVGPIAGVLDGASIPAGIESCCARDAAWYVRRLVGALVPRMLDADVPLADALADGIAAVATEHQCPRDGASPSAALALARESADALEYLVLADCTVVADVAGAVEHVTDERVAGIDVPLRTRIRQRLRDGATFQHPDHAADMRALAEQQLTVRNTDEGFWVASDDPAAAVHALSGAWPRGAVTRAALLSDGAARAVTTLGVHGSWGELLDALSADDVAACLRAVRDAEDADPQALKLARSSRSDDATIVRLDVGARVPPSAP